MELRELRSFCTAARLRSISRAAEQLGLRQSTVTTHVKKLESELGLLLFDRVKRPIQLTAAGAKLAELATPLLEGIDNLATSTAKTELEGPVRVASMQEIISHTLLRAVKTFASSYPYTRLRLRSGTQREVLGMVEQGEVDLGIVPGPPRRATFDFQELFDYELVAIGASGAPSLSRPVTSVEQVTQHPLILGPRGTYTRTIFEAELRRKGLSYDVAIELDSVDMIKKYVALGLGMSVVPLLAIEPHDGNELWMTSMTALVPAEPVGIVTLRGKTMSKPVMDFIAVMKATLSPSGLRPPGQSS